MGSFTPVQIWLALLRLLTELGLEHLITHLLTAGEPLNMSNLGYPVKKNKLLADEQ